MVVAVCLYTIIIIIVVRFCSKISLLLVLMMVVCSFAQIEQHLPVSIRTLFRLFPGNLQQQPVAQHIQRVDDGQRGAGLAHTAGPFVALLRVGQQPLQSNKLFHNQFVVISKLCLESLVITRICFSQKLFNK